MISHFAVCDERGKVLRFGTCPEQDIPYQANSGETAYVCPPQVNERYRRLSNGDCVPMQDILPVCDKQTISAGGVDTATLTFPEDCESVIITVVSPDGTLDRVEVTDGSFELSTTLPGDFILFCEMFPYQTQQVTIHAV